MRNAYVRVGVAWLFDSGFDCYAFATKDEAVGDGSGARRVGLFAWS